MKHFIAYLKSQEKRMMQSFLAVFIMTLLLMGAFGLLAWMQLKINNTDKEKQKVPLGIVGDTEDTYLGFGIYALENLDSSRYTLKFEYLEENEARNKLEKGKLAGYVRIPDGFVESVVSGENLPVTYVFGGSQQSLGGQLIEELSDTISAGITETQAGIYSMQEFYLNQGELEEIYEDVDTLNLRYFDLILSREEIYQVETVAGGHQLSVSGYYLSAILLVFLLAWGMNGGALLVKKDQSFSRVMASRGMGILIQTGGEFLAFILFMGCNYIGITGILLVCAEIFKVQIPEIPGVGGLFRFFAGCIPVVLCVGAMIFFLYTVVDSVISGLLLNFLGAIGLGYLSGCFYPLSFFPEEIQKVAAVLPSGVAMEYMKRLIWQRNTGEQAVELLLYAGVFLCAAVLVNRRKLQK